MTQITDIDRARAEEAKGGNAWRAYLRAHRAACGLSLSAAARRIGCTKAHLHDLESGRSANPSIKLLQGVADAYGRGIMEVAHYAAGWGDDTAGMVDAALIRGDKLAQLPALIMANIEECGTWTHNPLLVTAHAHAYVLHHDLPAAIKRGRELERSAPGDHAGVRG